MTTFEARIDLPAGAAAPDAYDPSRGRIPSSQFVVSRHADGSVASTYGDLSWNRTPYDPDGRTRHLHFSFWDEGGLTPARENLISELRWLIFILIYMRPGSPLSNASLGGYLVALRRVAKNCDAKSIRVQDALGDPQLMMECTEGTHNAGLLGSLLNLLNSLGEEQVGFSVAGKSAIIALGNLYRAGAETSKQFPPIPTRIYSDILATLSSELDELEQVIEPLLRLYADCRRDPLLGREKSRQKIIRRVLKMAASPDAPELPELLVTYGLDVFFAATNSLPSIQGFSSLLSEALMIASLQIQAFSGMRHNEVMALPYNCLDSVHRDGRTHYVICGRVTKLSKGLVKRTRWVTSASGARAVRLAQRIAGAIYSASGHSPSHDVSKPTSHYLFVSPQFMNPSASLRATKLNLNTFVELRARLQPAITEADLVELERIDPHRSWRSEDDFQIGRPWKLTSHQFRRSLALYAQRSGLVSLPSLKRQLQHITQEMSSYYARGSAFAKDFIGDDKTHFGYEWQETQPVSQYLSYAAHVLMTDDVLFGAHSHWVDHRLKDGDGIVMFDRETTLRRFKQGQLAYRETLIGGCVNVGECEQAPVDIFEIRCLTSHCKNIVGSLPKLDRVIAVQRKRVEKLHLLDPDSPEYRNEAADLAALEATRENVLKKTTTPSEAT